MSAWTEGAARRSDRGAEVSRGRSRFVVGKAIEALQLQMVFTSADENDSSTAVRGDAESVVAMREPERPAVINSLMEAVCERENLKRALRRVKANKGSPGIDGMTVEQLSRTT